MRSVFQSIQSRTLALPRPQRLMISWILAGMIAALDIVTGPDLSLSLFYVLPLALVTWNSRRPLGLVTVALISCVWVAENIATPPRNIPLFVWNISSRIAFMCLVVWLLRRLRDALERERRQARYDALTGLLNRYGFDEAAALEIRRALRSQRPLAIAYVDLDNFKLVNDQLGHSAGDRLLSSLAATMRQSLRITDLVARLGGDEFVLLLPETDTVAAHTILGRLQCAIDQEARRLATGVTASMGAVVYHRPPESVDLLLRAADEIMYTVKQTSKNDLSIVVAPIV